MQLSLQKYFETADDTRRNQCTQRNLQRCRKRTGRRRNKKTSRNHPDNSIIKVMQNTERSPGDLQRDAVTQTPVRNHQFTLLWKTLKGVNGNHNNSKEHYVWTILSNSGESKTNQLQICYQSKKPKQKSKTWMWDETRKTIF